MQRKKLNEYPQPAVLSRGACIEDRNDKAQALFRFLEPGSELPGVLALPDEADCWEGCVTLEGRMYRVTATRDGEQTLYLLNPQEQQTMSEAQMDGALYRMRALMGEFHRELAPYVAGEREQFADTDRAQFAKSYYRMLRLMDHMDFLRDAAAGQLSPARERLDLDRLCDRIALECDGLLREMEVRVVYEGTNAPVFVSGDGEMLRDALLELISNCARRRRKGGALTLRLSRQGKWARLCVTDDGPPATTRERLTLTTRGAMPLIPTPDAGAGLGLSVVETILRLHNGAMLISADESAAKLYLIIPIAERTGASIPLHSPRPERNAGMNPYVIALSDVLSEELIRADWCE